MSNDPGLPRRVDAARHISSVRLRVAHVRKRRVLGYECPKDGVFSGGVLFRMCRVAGWLAGWLQSAWDTDRARGIYVLLWMYVE